MQPIIPEHTPGQSCLHVFLSGHQVIAGEYSSLSLSMGETEAGQWDSLELAVTGRGATVAERDRFGNSASVDPRGNVVVMVLLSIVQSAMNLATLPVCGGWTLCDFWCSTLANLNLQTRERPFNTSTSSGITSFDPFLHLDLIPAKQIWDLRTYPRPCCSSLLQRWER